ncbi:MAG: hypothetical protein K2W95_24910 [Candidatus Obscuribacterales bacterium]|nr:hypothetical protein [Candidatus Obscuribacterales bacterium]
MDTIDDLEQDYCDDDDDSDVGGEDCALKKLPGAARGGLLPLPRMEFVAAGPVFDEALNPVDGAARRPLSGDDLKRAQYLQQTLTNLVPVFFSADRTGFDKMSDLQIKERLRQHEKETEQLTKDLTKEKADGVFGPATKLAYERYVAWLQAAVPATVVELDSLKLQLPSGTPISLETDRLGRASDPELYRALAADGQLALDLQLPTGKLPTDEQLNKLDAAYNWLARSADAVKSVRQKHQEDVINGIISDQGLPDGWKRRSGDNFETWVNSAENVVNLAVRTRNYIEAMQSLFKASRHADFPLEMPPGTTLVVRDSYGKEHKLTEVSSAVSRSVLKSGTLTKIKLDLPADLRQEEPGNKEKLERLRDWLHRVGDKVDQAVGELRSLNKNKDAVIMFGDHEVANGKAVFNPKGEFVKIADAKYVPKGGEYLRDFNLAGYSFDVEQINDGPDAGKFRIKQYIQAEKAYWYSYQNIRQLGVEQVGKPMKVDEKIVGPDDFVPVRTGDKIELVMAKNLLMYKRVQQAWYYGEKGLAVTMDAAMLASGVIEIGAAVRGARIAATSTHAALKLSTSGAAWEVGKGLVRVGVAGAGILNNAGGRDFEAGRTINHLRGLYFLGDVSLGLACTGWQLFRAGKAAEALSTADKVHTIIRGRKASEGVEALSGLPWVGQAHIGTEWAFKATEVLFVPFIVKDLRHEIMALMEGGKRDAARDAILYIGDGRGLQKAENGAFNPADPRILQSTQRTIDSYKDALCRGRSQDVANELKSIFDRAKKLNAPEASEKERAEFRRELLTKLTFSADEIHKLNRSHPSFTSNPEFAFTDQQLLDLLNPDKRKSFPQEVVSLAQKMLQSRNPDVMSAARIGLLFVSRDKDGKINADLGSTSVTVPAFTQSVDKGRSSRSVNVPERSYDQKLTAAMVVRDLQRDLEHVGSSNRGIVVGDVLTRIGALTHRQYGGVLQNVLKNPEASREDKLGALSDALGARMAVIIDGIAREDRANASAKDRVTLSGKNHGLTAEALMRQLEQTASTDKDPDVRAMSAALLYGLKEPDAARRSELLSGFNTLLEQHRNKPGEFGAKMGAFLKNELSANLPEKDTGLAERVREAKLNAALSLALITDKSDGAMQRQITETLVSSFRAQNAVVRERALGALLPERLEQLQKDNPKLADQLRSDALAAVKKPETRTGEAQLIRLLEKLPALLQNGDSEFKRELQSKLHDLLRNRESNKEYAAHFPQLRAAAIDVLVGLGSRESLDLIRSHSTAQDFLKVGGKTIAAGEADAGVRLAAVKALDKLSDPYLRTVVTVLVDREIDPAVAAYLRDVRFAAQRIDPDSRRWKDLYENTRKELIGFGKKYPYLNAFSHDVASEWLNENFPLLDKKTFDAEAKAAVDNSTSWLWRRATSEVEINSEEMKAYSKVYENRMAQFKQLQELARNGGEDGNKAKLALYYIATQNGSVLGAKPGLDAGAVAGYYDKNHLHKISEPDWRMIAARELLNLAQSNCEGKDVISRLVKDALCANREVPTNVSFHFIDAWRALGKDTKSGISREEQAVVTAEALKVELSRLPGLRSAALQKDFIEDLHKLGHRVVLPTLQAMVDSNQLAPEVKDAARATINSFMYSVKGLWRETKEDKTSTGAERSERLQRALEDRVDSEATVQEIFNAYKGYKLADAKDPGLRQLQLAMSDGSERVRLAAAKIVIESELPNKHPARAKAVSTLLDLTLTGSTPTYHSEAYELLGKLSLQENKPFMVAAGERLYQLEKVGSRIKATLLQMQPATGNHEPCGFVYGGGSSFKWELNASKEIVQVWENGANWKRTTADGKLTDQWVNAQTGEKWHGSYKLLGEGKYQYHSRGKNVTHVRDSIGKWTEVPVKKSA